MKWIVRVIDMPGNVGFDAPLMGIDKSKRRYTAMQNLSTFDQALNTWQEAVSKTKLEAAYTSNIKGMKSALQRATMRDRFVAVYAVTDVGVQMNKPVFPAFKQAAVLAKIRVNSGAIDISEIIKSPIAPKTESHESPVWALMAWAATCAPVVSLTANTVGLIGLYQRYGFEVHGVIPIGKQMAIKSGNELAQVDIEMRLTEKGEQFLTSKYKKGIFWDEWIDA